MSDTTFVAQTTIVPVAWLSDVNAFVYRGVNPSVVTSTGSLNAYTITLPSSGLTALTVGEVFCWTANFTNTGAATLVVVGASSIASHALTIQGSALTNGQVTSGALVVCRWNGTSYQIENIVPALTSLLSSNNTWTGTNAFTAASAFTAATTVVDNLFSLLGNGDATKIIQFDSDQLPTGITRTLYPTIPIRAVVGADTFVAADYGKLVTLSGSFTMSTTAAATLGSGWYCRFQNIGTGTITIDPNGAETISVPGGPQTAGTTATFPYSGTGVGNYNMSGGILICDGSGFRVIHPTEVHGEVLITATGAFSFVVPAGVTAIWRSGSAGGAGGGAAAAGTNAGGGGGGGEWINESYLAVVPGATLSGSVGTAGTGSVNGGAVATAGGNTTFDTLTLNGGSPGQNSSTGGAGGTGGGGTAGSAGGEGTGAGNAIYSPSGGSSFFGRGGVTGVATAKVGAGFGAGGAGRGNGAGDGASGTQGFFLIRW